MDESVTRKEHEEFARRIDEENSRQNRRIDLLEGSVREIQELTATVKELATNMKNMLAEQEKQGRHLEALESRDGEMWRKLVGYIITAIAGVLVGFIFTQIGM